MIRRRTVLFALAIVFVAGCTTGSTPTPSSAAINPIEQHNTVYFSGTLTASSGAFVMNGELVGCFGHVGPESCEDVRIQLYAENGTLLGSEYVGRLHGRRNISVKSGDVPHYVILTSPDVWGAERTTVDYYRYDEGVYLGRAAGDRDDLPVDLRTPGPKDSK